MNKSHYYFRNPEEGLVEFKSRPGGGGNDEEEEEKDYKFMANILSESRVTFDKDIDKRHKNRTLEIPTHFDLIEIEFFGAFDQPLYEGYYNNKFGLALLHLSTFNRKGLFAIEDQDKFDHFLLQINQFIEFATEDSETNFDGKIKYIKSFKLFSTKDMFGNIDNFKNIHLTFLGKSFIETTLINPQKKIFEEYLISKGIEYKYTEQEAELFNVSEELLFELFNNFDFIYASCSGSGAIIRPSKFNTPVREYGFEITNADSDLPIIGIIDTGISSETPLKSILIGENGDFDTTNTGSFLDNANHGTGVATFAALGNKLIPEYKGQVEADAKLLPIKILDSTEGAISQQAVIELIKKAYHDYNVRIFTLTIGYSKFPLIDNQEFSSYARMLDELTSEFDILIFISTSNNIFNIESYLDYPLKFKEDDANIAPPAESMNNITIGAIADNFMNTLKSLSTTKDFPAIYSRKFHYNFDDDSIFNMHTGNSLIRKPDILCAGGDYTEYMFMGNSGFDYGGEAGLEVLSSDLHERTYYEIGTSYSAPLAANLAAKLVSLYPNLDMQSIKALLINGSHIIKTGNVFRDFSNGMQNRVFGYGIPNNESVQFSNENKVTLILEDEIYPNYTKLFPLQLPKYLNSANRNYTLIKIDATLCFKFPPKPDNQLLYCPFHVTFAIGKNLLLNEFHKEIRIEKGGKERETEVADGFNGNSTSKIKIGSSNKGWVQDYYYKGKITSNVQKASIKVNRGDIIDEQNCLKIAINSAFHKLLSEAEKEPYNIPIPFSLVITIEQFPIKNEILPSLYNELVLINQLDAIGEIELELEV